jgi:hypothetical protein
VHIDQEAEINASAETFTPVSNVPVRGFGSEEDVKSTIVLPLLRTLDYEDADSSDEARTGREYVDVVVDRFPAGIVVEMKSPRTKLTDQGIAQGEA